MKRIAAIFAVALLLRLGMVGLWRHTGHGNRLSSDSDVYYGMAQSLAQGKGFLFDGRPTSRRAPLYPLFMTGLVKFFPFPIGVQVAQAFVGSLSCLLLFGIGKELFGRGTGLWASGLMAVDYLSIRHTVSILPETLFVFFVLSLFFLLMRSQREKSFAGLLAAGGLAGLSLLTKDALIYYFPLVALWLFFKNRGHWREGVLQATGFLIALLIVIAPWVVRNSLLYRNFVLITMSSGHTFYIGNNPLVTVKTDEGDWGVGRDYQFPQDPGIPPLWTLEADRYLFKKGREFVREHPRRFVELMGRKMVKMWRPFYPDSPVLAQWASALSYFPVMVLALPGLVWSWRKRAELFPVYVLILYITLVYAVTISGLRYRVPAMPFLMVFAGLAASELWQRLRNRQFTSVSRFC